MEGPSGRVQWSRWYSRQLYWAPAQSTPKLGQISNMTILFVTVGRPEEEIGPAQELGLDLAGALAGGGAVGHQLLVGVEVDVDVERDLLVRHADPRTGEAALVLARVVRVQAEVLEVVNPCT